MENGRAEGRAFELGLRHGPGVWTPQGHPAQVIGIRRGQNLLRSKIYCGTFSYSAHAQSAQGKICPGDSFGLICRGTDLNLPRAICVVSGEWFCGSLSCQARPEHRPRRSPGPLSSPRSNRSARAPQTYTVPLQPGRLDPNPDTSAGTAIGITDNRDALPAARRALRHKHGHLPVGQR